MGSCGYECLRYLLAEYMEDSMGHLGVSLKLQEALHTMEANYKGHKELSFADMHDMVALFGWQGSAFEVLAPSYIRTPCIAKLQLRNWHHFVVLVRYGNIVTYVEPGRGIRRVPRILFDMAFSRYIFLVDCF